MYYLIASKDSTNDMCSEKFKKLFKALKRFLIENGKTISDTATYYDDENTVKRMLIRSSGSNCYDYEIRYGDKI